MVQFYEREERLYSLVGDFLAEGLGAGEPAVVIAAQPHHSGFLADLNSRGMACDGVNFVDAQEMLARFMAGSMPDPHRFTEHVGGALRDRSNGQLRVRAFGDMVNLLWHAGNPEAAVRVEELWNALATSQQFSLLCAYHIGSFVKESDIPLFDDICDTHSHIFFEPFRQADSSNGEGGLGLGLAIVKHLTELHGGNVAVDSDEGEGATFTVTLPLVRRSA